MKGIIVNDFEAIIKRNSFNINEVKKDVNRIYNCQASLSRLFSFGDSKVLFGKLNNEINELDDVKKKIDAYQEVMQKIILSYKQQAQELARSINRISPDNDII